MQIELNTLANEKDVRNAIFQFKGFTKMYDHFSEIDEKISVLAKNNIGKRPFYIQ